MECDSTISFRVKSPEDRESLIDALKIFADISASDDDTTTSKLKDATEWLNNSKFNINADELYQYLKELDTGINHIDVDSDYISISLFPWEYPEELCQMLFPLLSKGGADRIDCKSSSEYGTQTLTFQGGRICKSEEEYDL